ncbi:MAG: hypothetical protein JO214_18080 [Frankiaceae bacterium]|nr:hypothetical protein [Frankiaceae bacterium]
MRRRGASVLLLALMTWGLTAATTGRASADSPVRQGWWTITNPGTPAVAVAPPDVPKDGLLVQGGPTGSNAYAALDYAVDGGQVATLTLRVTKGSASVPGAALQLCPLRNKSFTAEQGGPIAHAPAYRCGKPIVSAKPDASGATYKFSVTSLISGGSLAVAILPTDPTARVVLDAPGSTSLASRPVGTHESPTPSPTPTSSVHPSAPPPTHPADTSGGSNGGFTSGGGFGGGPSTGGAVLAAPEAQPRPVVASAPAAASAPATFNAASERGASSDSATPGAVALGVGVLALAIALWTLSGNTESETSEPEAA